MILINGNPADTLNALDRGLHYGDGLFETIAIVDGRPRLWDRHMRRLARGCERLRLPPPDEGLLQMEAERLCAGHQRAVLKIIITRGVGARGYRIEHADPGTESKRMTRLLAMLPAADYPPEYYRHGVTIRICATRLGSSPALAGIKHLNRLEQVLARDEWSDPAIAEGLMLDQHDHVIEGTMSNLFAVKDGCLLTPDLSECGVAGVMRDTVLDAARESVRETRVVRFTLDTVMHADELFLCNSLIGVWPVRQVDGVPMQSGTITRAMLEAVSGLSLMPEGAGVWHERQGPGH